MRYRGASWSPTGAMCHKCGEEIMGNQGRRFRCNWYHEGCLPESRLKKLTRRRGVVACMQPDGWQEVEAILNGESRLSIDKQAALIYIAGETIEQVLQSPAEMKAMARETGLSTEAETVVRTYLDKVRAKQEQLLKIQESK